MLAYQQIIRQRRCVKKLLQTLLSNIMFDIIGEIHGNADKLVLLLEKMGYTKQSGIYSNSSRKALLVGDYIDREPQIPQTLSIVRSMVENNNAIALMGNHEYNTICFNTKNQQGDFLREHSTKNWNQHRETLHQFESKQSDYYNHIEWFNTLPLFFETNEFRAVHACWGNDKINFLKRELQGNLLREGNLEE